VRVVEEGTGQKGWASNFRCTGSGNGGGGCRALLLVEEDDVYQTSSHARDETTNYCTFRCSECGVETDLEELDLAVRRRVEERVQGEKQREEEAQRRGRNTVASDYQAWWDRSECRERLKLEMQGDSIGVNVKKWCRMAYEAGRRDGERPK
jgi:hypothetical protein